VFIDNKSTISLCKNPIRHERTKHIDLRYHYIRDCMEKGTITVEYISTNEQKADILMKPLGRTRFQELCGKVGIVDTQFAPQG
jgi:hypothetical protein